MWRVYVFFVAVIAALPSSAQAQSRAAYNLPANYTGMLQDGYKFIVNGKLVFENNDLKIYQSSPVKVIVKRPPTERYTRERLWNEFSPVLRSLYDGSAFFVNFYFEGVFSRGRQLMFGEPRPSDRVPMFAHARFVLSDDPTSRRMFGNFSAETFGPTIFGMAGHLNSGTFSAETSYLRSELASQYRDFPKHSFLDAFAYDNQAWKLYEQRREQDSKNFWRAFISGLANGGVLEQIQCDNAEREGRSIPWYCEQSDFNQSRRNRSK